MGLGLGGPVDGYGSWHSEAFGWDDDTLDGSILGFRRVVIKDTIMGAWPLDRLQVRQNG